MKVVYIHCTGEPDSENLGVYESEKQADAAREAYLPYDSYVVPCEFIPVPPSNWRELQQDRASLEAKYGVRWPRESWERGEYAPAAPQSAEEEREETLGPAQAMTIEELIAWVQPLREFEDDYGLLCTPAVLLKVEQFLRLIRGNPARVGPGPGDSVDISFERERDSALFRVFADGAPVCHFSTEPTEQADTEQPVMRTSETSGTSGQWTAGQE